MMFVSVALFVSSIALERYPRVVAPEEPYPQRGVPGRAFEIILCFFVDAKSDFGFW